MKPIIPTTVLLKAHVVTPLGNFPFVLCVLGMAAHGAAPKTRPTVLFSLN